MTERFSKRCSHCKGTGEVSDYPCFNCRGKGKTTASTEQEVQAAYLIQQEIHKRDGIVMGRDPLGNLCRCGCNSYTQTSAPKGER